jgi:hypothetical protein
MRHLAWFVALAIAFALLVPTFALAQEARVVGTVDGLLGGEPRSWYFLDFDTEDGPQATAYYLDVMPGTGLFGLTFQAHAEPRFVTEGTLAIDLTLFGGLPSGCPCELDEVEVLYFSASSMFSEVYVSDEPGTASLTLTRFDEIEPGVFTVEGHFEALLHYLEDLGSPVDVGRPLAVSGSFVIERFAEASIDD